MTRDQAIAHLRAMQLGAVKARSNIREAFGEEGGGGLSAEELLAQTNPFLFGPKSVVPFLDTKIRAIEAGAPITGQDLFNLMTIAFTIEPSIAMCSLQYEAEPLPEPSVEMVMLGVLS